MGSGHQGDEVGNMHERPMRIFWDASGGLHVYQLGVMTAVLENPLWKKTFEKFKDNLSFEGASGGAGTALSVSAAVHGIKPIRWFFGGNTILLFRELSTRLFGMFSSSSSLIRYFG